MPRNSKTYKKRSNKRSRRSKISPCLLTIIPHQKLSQGKLFKLISFDGDSLPLK